MTGNGLLFKVVAYLLLLLYAWSANMSISTFATNKRENLRGYEIIYELLPILKNAGKARKYGLYRYIRTSKGII